MYIKTDAIQLGSVDISAIRDKVAAYTDDKWLEDISRQELFDAHKHTHTIKLLFDADYRHNDPTEHPSLKQFERLLEPLKQQIVTYYSSSMRQKKVIRKHGLGYFIRIIFTRLLPGSAITPHLDNGFSLKRCHRIHLPIITNDACQFRVGESSFHMQAGQLWEINNRLIHAVENKGDEARVHLILDYVQPGEVIFDREGPLTA